MDIRLRREEKAKPVFLFLRKEIWRSKAQCQNSDKKDKDQTGEMQDLSCNLASLSSSC